MVSGAAPGGPILDSKLMHVVATAADESQRLAAWEELYRRHYNFLRGICKAAHAEAIGDSRVEELVHDTFMRAYEKAATFKAAATDAEGDRRHLRGWLAAVAQNIFRDYFRGQPEIVFGEEEDCIANVPDDNLEPTARLQQFEHAFAKLTTREQEVLRETALWHDGSAKNQRMPNEPANRLAISLGTTPNNIRQIRARAKNKLRALLQQPGGPNAEQ